LVNTAALIHWLFVNDNPRAELGVVKAGVHEDLWLELFLLTNCGNVDAVLKRTGCPTVPFVVPRTKHQRHGERTWKVWSNGVV
jgi:hypothetical protein